MNMGNFFWSEQGKRLQLYYRLEEKEIVDAHGVGKTAEQEIEGLVPYLFTSAAGQRTFCYQVGKRTTVSGLLANVIGKTEFLTLCQKFIDSLIRLQQQGIDTQKLVYHGGCIFLNKKDLRPEWVFLPLREYDAPENSMNELLKELVFQAKLRSQEDGAYSRDLLNFLQANPMADLANLKQAVESLLQKAAFDFQLSLQNSKKGKRGKRAKKQVASPAGYPYPSNAGNPSSCGGVPPAAGGAPYMTGQAYASAAWQSGGYPAWPAVQAQAPAPAAPRQEGAAWEKGSTGTGFELLYRQTASAPQRENECSSETVVLGETEEGTTVLGTDSAAAEAPPQLIRLRTGERITVRGPKFFLGKGKNGTDYVVTDNSAVSRVHACIALRGGEYYVEDQNSTNHTYLNGSPVPPGTPEKICGGDVLRLADEDFRFEQPAGK